MAINPISAMPFKGLWEVNTINPQNYRNNRIQKTFVYHPFADEKVDTLELDAKKKLVSGVYTCTEYDDNDHDYNHTILNRFVLGDTLGVTAEKYFTEIKDIVKEFGKGFKFLETDEMIEKVVPKKTEFGKSEYVTDYTDVKKVS